MDVRASRIRVTAAAKVMGRPPQAIRDDAAEDKLPFAKSLQRAGNRMCRIDRAAFNKYLGKPPDYIWPEELE